jgi:hypothetical protein
MRLRYIVPFKDLNNNSYEVMIYREDYAGEVTELTGAVSCFVVSGTDEDFMYHPIRTSSATLNILDSDLLLDLYSINNQHAPVKLLKNGKLEWTGYIKPEQLTQPYNQVPQSIGVECVCALSTLEHIEYKANSLTGSLTMWELIKNLIAKANGGYNGIYIPNVYGSDRTLNTNIFEEIDLIENNFLNEETNCYEILSAVCKFFNWTIFDCKGYLYFVDADWKGEYRLYDEGLTQYTNASINEVLLQNVGYNGSDSNTLDVIPGYNKASVKAINNVFDDVVKDEDYDTLQLINEDPLILTYKQGEDPHAVRKIFLKASKWNLYQYESSLDVQPLNPEEVYKKNNTELNKLRGALLMREADYKCVSLNDNTPAEGVTDFDYKDSIQIRIAETSSAGINIMGFSPAVTMEGEYAVYADCAIGFNCSIDGYFDDNMLQKSSSFANKIINVSVECGGRYYDGTKWVDSYAYFTIELDESGSVKSNKTPFMPYDISGYVIPMDFFIGKPKITIMCPVWMTDDFTHSITGTKIRDLRFEYSKKTGMIEEGEAGDRVYDNVVNEAYMSSADEISFEISSYNADGATFSKALIKGGWLTDNLYCKIVEKMVRPEELMIRRIVNRYGETKIKLTEALCMTDDITPLTILYDRAMSNKSFRMTSGEWDYQQNRLMVQIQEDVK